MTFLLEGRYCRLFFAEYILGFTRICVQNIHIRKLRVREREIITLSREIRKKLKGCTDISFFQNILFETYYVLL